MTYWFVPSTYSGRPFGRGIVGYGRIVGGGLYGGVAIYGAEKSIIQKAKALANAGLIAEKEADKIEDAVIEQKPVPIKKETAGFLSGVKNLAGKAWNVGKAVYNNPIGRMAINAGLAYLGNAYGPQAIALAKNYGNKALDYANDAYKATGKVVHNAARSGAQGIINTLAPMAGNSYTVKQINNAIKEQKYQDNFLNKMNLDSFSDGIMPTQTKITPINVLGKTINTIANTGTYNVSRAVDTMKNTGNMMLDGAKKNMGKGYTLYSKITTLVEKSWRFYLKMDKK